MILKLYENNTNPQHIQKVVELLRNGGVIIFPTDTVYAFGCDIFKPSAVETIARFKEKDLRKAELSFVCEDLSQISEYARMSDEAFKLIRKNLPGPFTFLLQGSSRLPRLFKDKKIVGVRIPDNSIALEIVRQLGNPIMVSSIFTDDDTLEYLTDPELIDEKFGQMVDLVIDGGYGGLEPSTVVDCTEDEPVVVREGKCYSALVL
jgi:tRNA threonylcarbamoyl adenosine modification protein (Sua5/YciO/YrdC/YwlC family)